MDIEEAYQAMQVECGIEVGDTVKVLRKAKTREMGWKNSWTEEMDGLVGEEAEVVAIREYGIWLKNSLWFPFFVLEKVKDANALPADIQKIIDNSDFGCQTDNVIKLVKEILSYIQNNKEE